jgi:hypothetical protein
MAITEGVDKPMRLKLLALSASSVPGCRMAVMSPGRWLQVMPAACRNVARPRAWAASASQVARSQGNASTPDYFQGQIANITFSQ